MPDDFSVPMPPPSAEAELVLAWIEADCARMSEKKRLKRLRVMAEIFERLRAAPTPIYDGGRRKAQAGALNIFNRSLARLASAGER